MRPVPPCVAATILALVLAGVGGPASAHPDTGSFGPTPGLTTSSAAAGAPRLEARTTKVLVISVDSLSSTAIRRLGPDRAPTLHRLIRQGASTLNARTEREQTETLPNHTGMVTGRRIDASHGGHGVTWNDDRLRPRTVQEAAGHRVASVFSVVDSARRDPGLFVSKTKLSLFNRSWPHKVDRFVVRENNRRLVRMVRADLVEHRRAFTFLHLSEPDVVGHDKGFLSPAYLRAVARADRRVGTLVKAIRSHRRLRRHLTLILTSDHGGRGSGHDDPTKLVDYRIPFIVWGAGVSPGTDLYALNPDYRDPGKRRARYRADRQPVRNAEVANLTTDLLGLKPVPGSRFDADHDLDVR